MNTPNVPRLVLLACLVAACSQPLPAPAPAAAADAAIAASPDATLGDAAAAPDAKDAWQAETACAYPPCGTPNVKAEPAQVAFAPTPAGGKAMTYVTLSNTGTGAWPMQRIEIESDPSFRVDCGNQTALAGQPAALEPPWSLKPGLQVECIVTFAPKDALAHSGQLRFVPVDPAQKTVVVPIQADVAPAKPKPCLAVQGSLDFGPVLIGTSVTKSVKLASCGTAPFHLTGWQVIPAMPVFQVKVVTGPAACQAFPQTPCPLAQSESLTLEVTYTPVASPLADKGVLSLAWDGGPAMQVPLSGTAPQAACPTAVVSVKEGNAVVPQTVLHLKGDASYATGNMPIKKYKWTVTQPAGSNQPLTPNASFANPALTANTAGEYEFCLEVWDAAGAKSCQPACVKVLVVPTNAIHVELLWNTPADADETDTGPGAGADMDLHFAHQMAKGPDLDCDGQPDPWFSNPFDCFWFNPNPSWGSTSPAAQDDASLDLDDFDGGGPENLNMVSPEGQPDDASTYSVGVHYWNDHDFGQSFATLTLYLQGVVVFKAAQVKMDPLDFWYVGKINSPNMMNGAPNLAPVTMCYQTGDACLAKTDPGNPAAGKMWQAQSAAKAAWCITKCYDTAAFTKTSGGSTALPNCKK